MHVMIFKNFLFLFLLLITKLKNVYGFIGTEVGNVALLKFASVRFLFQVSNA